MRKEFRDLQTGKLKEDTSFVYRLPYEDNTSHWMIQGYFTHFSHKERAAIDFKMKRGTKVVAARDGVVVRMKEDGNKGGLNRKFRRFGNFITVEHSDGTRAGYWHLQQNGVLVNLGDTVHRGQVIGLSGKTGYTALPHLHFIVWKYDSRGNWIPVATRFQTTHGATYLRALREYRAIP